ncbi:DNA polymerase III subunit delta [Weeksellaceae bacterium A-14]
MKELDLLIKNIKNKELLPIYFLQGPEPYYIDQLVKVLENDILEEEEKAFNQTVVYGKDTTFSDILAAARQFPMMGDKVVLIVKEAQDLKMDKDEEKALIQYAENPVPSTVLVFAYKGKKLDGKKRNLITALKPYLFLSEEVKDWQLPKVIQEELNKQKIKTAPNIANLLAEHLGSNLSRIFNEINKVKIVLKEGQILDENLVERYIGISKEYNVFELQNAIAMKDTAKAFKIVNFMGKNEKEHPVVNIVAVLFGFFSKVIVYQCLTDQSKDNVARELGVHPFFVKDYQAAARLYPLKHATRIISILREIDLKSKGLGANQTSDGELLKELVYKIINVDKTKVKI